MDYKKICTVVVVCFSLVTYVSSNASTTEVGYDSNKSKLLSYIISKQLSENHYTHKPINDSFSEDTFKQYIKQVDPQKRYFIQQDLDALSPYAKTLDDEMTSGHIVFPNVAEEIIKQRTTQILGFLDEIEKVTIDFQSKELLEVDPEKLSFSTTVDELKQRWLKTVTYQVVSRYLDLVDINKVKVEAAIAPENKSDADLRKEAKEKVLKSNREVLGRILKREKSDVVERYFTAVARAFDPHSSFMAPTQKEDFDIHMRGSLEGIGAVLQEEDGFIKVMRIIPGGAAYRQKKLHASDTILMVAQSNEEPVDITDMPIRDAVQLIRGPKGSEVRLTVKTAEGKISIIPIIRDVVQLEETFVKSAVLTNKTNEKFAYLKIPSFYRDFEQTKNGGSGRNVTDDVIKALDEFKSEKTQGLIIDLRNNGGGALVDAVKIAGLFIETGPIVQIKTNDQKAEVLYDYDKSIYYDGAIVVLINRFSASASEILAGALQDYNRAVIIGSDHSYGKGTVQTLINLDTKLPFFSVNMTKYKPLGHLKVTTQKFYRVNGESTQRKGIVSDIILPDRFQYAETGEQYMENSMPWDTIDPVDFDMWKDHFNLNTLKATSSSRVKNDDDFLQIEKDANESKKRLEHTLIAIDIDSVKKARESVKDESANTGSPHRIETSGLSKEDEAKEYTKEEQQQLMVDRLQEDPYVIESLSVLDDFS
nr:carboxy terminal-processing peptidase [Desulfobulbaceae bacterium]